MTIIKECCAECRFSQERVGDFCVCRRNAPIAIHDTNRNFGVYEEAFQPRWPFMRDIDWCGEFELKGTK